MSKEPIDAERETVNATADDAPTADLRTGEESSEKLDAAFELLADPLRRDALARLDDVEDARLDLSTLAATVASSELSADDAASDATGASGTDDEQSDDGRSDVRSIALELHHVHLPKLESHGVVAYDPERRTVRYRERAWLNEWLEHVRREERA